MDIVDMSTRKLKRFYLKQVRKAWNLASWRQDGFARDIGLSKDYWSAVSWSQGAKRELVNRGWDVP